MQARRGSHTTAWGHGGGALGRWVASHDPQWCIPSRECCWAELSLLGSLPPASCIMHSRHACLTGYTKGYQGKRIDNTSARDEPYEFVLGQHQVGVFLV